MDALGKDQEYGIGPAGGYVSMGGRVCDLHQNIFDLMSYLEFLTIVIYFP